MKIGLLQKWPCHTDVLAAMYETVVMSGNECVIYATPRNLIPFIGYQPELISLDDLTKTTCDVLILITADEWSDVSILKGFEDRLMSVQHALGYRYKLSDRSVTLVPRPNYHQWIFPIMNLGAWQGGTNIGVVGNINGEFPRNKDLDDLKRFEGRYVHLTGLSDSELIESVRHLAFLWIPIPPMSGYMSFIFSGPIGLGVSIGVPMIMPERLRAFYGFPSEAILTYESSILEVDFDKPLKMDMMTRWRNDRAIENVKNLKHIIDNEFRQTY